MPHSYPTKLELKPIDPSTDFPALVHCFYSAFQDPYQKFVHAYFPIHGAYEDAVHEVASRLKLWHTQDPTSHWRKVVDHDTGTIAGASVWNFYTCDPFATPHIPDVTWFPDDSRREYANQVVQAVEEPRTRLARRAHAFLFMIFTHPSYRRQGVAQQMINWGVQRADELGLEVFIDSTVYGRPLYEINGFRCIEINHIHVQTDDPDEEWREMDEKIGPFTMWIMWRPAGGKCDGELVKMPLVSTERVEEMGLM